MYIKTVSKKMFLLVDFSYVIFRYSKQLLFTQVIPLSTDFAGEGATSFALLMNVVWWDR